MYLFVFVRELDRQLQPSKERIQRVKLLNSLERHAHKLSISQYLSERFLIRHPAPRNQPLLNQPLLNQPLLNQPLLNQPSTFRNELCMLVAHVVLFVHQDTNCTQNW